MSRNPINLQNHQPQYLDLGKLEDKLIRIKRELAQEAQDGVEKFKYSFVELDLDDEGSLKLDSERPMTLTLSKISLDPVIKDNLLRKVQELFFAQDAGESVTTENKISVLNYLKSIYQYNQTIFNATDLAQSNQGFGVVFLGKVSDHKIDADLEKNNQNPRQVLAIFDQTKEVEETKLPNAIIGAFTGVGTAALNLFRATKKPIQPPFIKYVGQDGSYSYNTYAEVFADEVPELRRQNREVIQLGDKKYLKISREFEANIVGAAQTLSGKINSLSNLHKIFGETFERMSPSQFRINQRTQEEFKRNSFSRTADYSEAKFAVRYNTIQVEGEAQKQPELDEQGNIKIYQKDQESIISQVNVNSLDYALAMQEMRQRIFQKGREDNIAELQRFGNEFKTENFVPLSGSYTKGLSSLVLEGDLERRVNPAPAAAPRVIRNLQQPAQVNARNSNDAEKLEILKHIFVVSAKAARIENSDDLKGYCGIIYDNSGTNNIDPNSWRDYGLDKQKARDFSHIFQHLTKEFGIVDNSINQVGKRLFSFIENIDDGKDAIQLYSSQENQRLTESISMQALIAKHQEIQGNEESFEESENKIFLEINGALNRKSRNFNQARNHQHQGR